MRFGQRVGLTVGAACLGAIAIAGQRPAPPPLPPAPPLPMPAILKSYLPVTAERLLKPKDDEWLMIRRTYDGWGYSPLDQINTSNVARLQPVWIFSTGAVNGHEAPPIVNGGVMFVPAFAGQLQGLPGGHISDVNVVRPVAVPGERQVTAVGRPCGRIHMPAHGKQLAFIGAVRAHHINPRRAAAVRNKRDLSSGLRIPSGRDIYRISRARQSFRVDRSRRVGPRRDARPDRGTW